MRSAVAALLIFSPDSRAMQAYPTMNTATMAMVIIAYFGSVRFPTVELFLSDCKEN